MTMTKSNSNRSIAKFYVYGGKHRLKSYNPHYYKLKDLHLPPPQSGADKGVLIQLDRLVGSGSYQKVRIFTKDCPYGPGICNSFIEANIIIENDNGVPSNEPTGSVYFSYCNNNH